jgi:hypothetical protein
VAWRYPKGVACHDHNNHAQRPASGWCHQGRRLEAVTRRPCLAPLLEGRYFPSLHEKEAGDGPAELCVYTRGVDAFDDSGIRAIGWEIPSPTARG